MPVAPTQIQRLTRSEEPWDRLNVAELSQTHFRTTLRGFDRDEVRAILDSVAADYRVLQLQNASLQRQLADLEGVLQAYHRGDGPSAEAGLQTAPAHHRSSTLAARDFERPDWTTGESLPESADDETVELLLKSIDRMLVEIPALPFE